MHALIRREGLSAEHWKTQNWLARADIDQADPSETSLLITSNKDFGIGDAGAWWIAYDAICLIDAEIKSANHLLGSRSQRDISPPFKIKRVSGSSSPEATSEYVRVEDWKPCSAKVYVGNVENLVKSLGGESLCGSSDQLDVALRELIQNARDAVMARITIDAEHVGVIKIQLRLSDKGEAYLDVEDDGVGMSERVLTGPLLDFGNSFWISSLVRSEFPGLRSSRFRSIGRFGIEFYSIFMVPAAVTVSTRRWDAGMNDVRTLSFPNGLTLRPTLSKGRPSLFGSYTSTRVSCRLSDAFTEISNITIRSGRMGRPNLHVKFEDFLKVLVAGLDVGVTLKTPQTDTFAEIHSPIVSTISLDDRKKWLADVCFVRHVDDQSLLPIIASYADRLRFLYVNEQVCGLATLPVHANHQLDFLFIRAIGGLASTVHGRGDADLIGFLNYHPNTARRETSSIPLAYPDMLQEWADEQVRLLRAAGISSWEWCVVTESLSQLSLDPLPVAHVMIAMDGNVEAVDFPDLITIVKTRGLAIFKPSAMDHIEIYHREEKFEDYPTFRPVRNSKFLDLGNDKKADTQSFSFLGSLQRYAQDHAVELKVEERRGVASAYFGPMHVLIVSIVT